MSVNQACFPVATMARVLGVSKAGFYAWRHRPPSLHAVADAALLKRIRTVHASSRQTYGAPRVHADLRGRGKRHGRKRIARLMRDAGLLGACHRHGGPTTTRRDKDARPAPDLVDRNFTASGPNQLWVADITYLPTAAGFLYLRVRADHRAYENADPFLITEPDGTIDCHASRYEALHDRAVRVHGSRFIPSGRTTIKLEGAVSAGYQAIIVAGVREPYILRQLDPWLDAMRERFKARVQEIFGGRIGPDGYDIHVRGYGRDGVMGRLEPLADQMGHEVGLLFTVTAADKPTVESIAKTFAHFALHYPIPEWGGLISGLAFPMAPAHVVRGEVFRFNLNHIVTPGDPLEMFRTELVEV